MKLLSREHFEARQAELTSARDSALAAYRSANLAAEMGDGTEADIRKAKDDLDAVDHRMDALRSAYAEVSRLQAVEVRKTRKAAHKKLLAETERLVSAREELIASIESKAQDVAAQIEQYDKLTAELRAAASSYRLHYIHNSAVGVRAKARMDNVLSAMTRNHDLRPLVDAVVRRDRITLNGKLLSDFEAVESRNVRFAVEQVAPEGDMA